MAKEIIDETLKSDSSEKAVDTETEFSFKRGLQ